MKTQEFSAKTVEDAVTEASIALGLPSSELHYEVVTEGSRGFLGIASKNAVIRVLGDEDLKKIEDEKKAQEAAKKEAAKKEAPKASKPAPEVKKEAAKAEAPKAAKPEKSEKSEKKAPLTAEELEAVKANITSFLSDIFKAMDLDVEMKITNDEENINVELSGAEMGVLIGKRGQTLDSLQYLTNLAVNNKSNHYMRVKIDTEDYRRRRKETLENLAKNVAFKVKRSKRSVELEPMNPFERRIIHSALQNDKFVTTHSEGEEPYRHVVVTLKK